MLQQIDAELKALEDKKKNLLLLKETAERLVNVETVLAMQRSLDDEKQQITGYLIHRDLNEWFVYQGPIPIVLAKEQSFLFDSSYYQYEQGIGWCKVPFSKKECQNVKVQLFMMLTVNGHCLFLKKQRWDQLFDNMVKTETVPYACTLMIESKQQ
jgi:hypothetical protein